MWYRKAQHGVVRAGRVKLGHHQSGRVVSACKPRGGEEGSGERGRAGLGTVQAQRRKWGDGIHTHWQEGAAGQVTASGDGAPTEWDWDGG